MARADEFLDLVGAANLIPGQNSTEIALFVGLRKGLARNATGPPRLHLSRRGSGVASGVGLPAIRPAPPVEGILRGVTPVVVAVVTHALWSLGKTTRLLATVGVLALVARAATHTSEIVAGYLVCAVVSRRYLPRGVYFGPT